MINYIRGFDTLAEQFLAAVGYIGAIMLAIILHECAHGYVAYMCGDDTAKLKGRLTLNPAAHFNLLGLIAFVLVGIGWANPVPINPNNFRNYRKDMLKVSVAGVTTNLVLAIISAGLLSLILLIFNGKALSQFTYLFAFLLVQFTQISLIVNISLMAFNLLPIYPLDGFRIVALFTKPNNPYCTFMVRRGPMLLLGVIIIGNLLSNISPYFDVFGIYMDFITRLVLKLVSLIFPNLTF